MGYKIADLLQFIDEPRIGTVTKEEVERAYEKYIIDEAMELGYIVVIMKDGKEIYKITDLGHTFLIAQKGLNVQEQGEVRQTKTDKKNFWLGVIAIIVAVLAIVSGLA